MIGLEFKLALEIVSLVALLILVRLHSKEIKSLKKMSKSKDKYIALLEKRAREERIYKNEQFINKQSI